MAKIDLTKVKALAEQAAQTGPDYSKQTEGGGDFKPPAEGNTRVRFTSYIETGIHTTSSGKFGDKTKPRAFFEFELSGPKHPPKVLEDGRKIPERISFTLPVGQNKKNDYSKLFKIMTADFPGRKNFAQLLGEAYLGTVVHRKFQKRGGGEGIAAELKNDAGFTIRSTTYEDPATNEVRQVKVDEPISDIRLFLWDLADTDQWDSIFIDGQYDDGNSKNKFQEAIKAAENLSGSAIEQALIEAGREDELVPAPRKERGENATEDEADTPDGDDTPETPAQEPVQEAQKPAQEAPKSAAKGKVAAAPKKPATAPKSKPPAPPAEDDGDPLQGL